MTQHIDMDRLDALLFRSAGSQGGTSDTGERRGRGRPPKDRTAQASEASGNVETTARRPYNRREPGDDTPDHVRTGQTSLTLGALARELDAYAKEHGGSRSSITRAALQMFFEAQGFVFHGDSH